MKKNALARSTSKKSKVIFLDTETTGLNPQKDKIIELGIISCSCDLDTCELLSIDQAFRSMEDPQEPLNPMISELTGITDQNLAGTKFVEEEIYDFIKGCSLIVAHNAAFDRAFIEKRFTALRGKNWGCSLNLKWDQYLPGSRRNLKDLLRASGFEFNGHRAVQDALAVAGLMYLNPDACHDLLTTLKTGWSKITVKIVASCQSEQISHILEKHKYSTDFNPNEWNRLLPKVNEEQELDSLAEMQKSFGIENLFQVSVRNVPLSQAFL